MNKHHYFQNLLLKHKYDFFDRTIVVFKYKNFSFFRKYYWEIYGEVPAVGVKSVHRNIKSGYAKTEREALAKAEGFIIDLEWELLPPNQKNFRRRR